MNCTEFTALTSKRTRIKTIRRNRRNQKKRSYIIKVCFLTLFNFVVESSKFKLHLIQKSKDFEVVQDLQRFVIVRLFHDRYWIPILVNLLKRASPFESCTFILYSFELYSFESSKLEALTYVLYALVRSSALTELKIL